MEVAWQMVASLLATWNGYLLVLNPIQSRIFRNGPTKHAEKVPFRIFIGVVIVQSSISGTLWGLVGLGPSIIAISTLGLVLGLLTFDINAAASPSYKFMGRTGVVPCSILCFVSSAVSFGLYTAWYLCIIPFVIWAPVGWLVGYIAAKMRLRRPRRSEVTMDLAKLVEYGTPQEVQDAINKGAKVNARLQNGMTPLMYAAANNQNPEVIATLLKAKADLKARDKDGMTPLMHAAKENKNPSVVSALVKAGADLAARDKSSLTPLLLAAGANPSPEVITALVEAGAEVNALSQNGFTPL
ncbi:MAG: ankyrin repeat domain-containing protein, partial [Spirochaetia bacterium]